MWARPTRQRRKMLEPRQCRAARAILGWSRQRLSEEFGIPVPTLERYERGETSPYLKTVATLRRTLERAGVIFIDPDSEAGPGIRLRDGRKA